MPVGVESVASPVELTPETAAKPSRLTDLDRLPGVVVVGSIHMDLVVRTANMPRPGETVLGSDFVTIPGGKGANQAVAAARLSAPCTMIGRVGDDAFGKRLRDGLEHAGVAVDHVRTTPNCPSGIAMITVDQRGENAITVVSGANGQLSPDDLTAMESVIAEARILVLQLEVPLPTVCRAAQLAAWNAVPVVLDPAPAPKAGLPDELLTVDTLTPNQTEAELLTGAPVRDVAEAKLAGAELVRRGVSNAVIKLGAEGAVVVTLEGLVEHVPAFPTNVVDTTAAGDAFTAGLAVGIAQGLSVVEAARMGCAAGSLAAGTFGAQQAMPLRSAVDQLLRSRM